MKKFVIMILFSLGVVLTADAQTFTQRLQKSAKGEGTVTVTHDKAVDDLVNCAQPATAPVKKQTSEKNSTEKHTTSTTTQPVAPVQQQVTDTTAVKQSTGRTMRVTGYRVQAFAGGNSRADKQKAVQTGNQLRQLFPHEIVYTHFYSPRWICRIGNYRTYEEAHQMLQELKKLGFESATIVKGKITVQY